MATKSHGEPAGRPGFQPTHPGIVLRGNLAAMGATQEAFADHIGVTRQTISAVLSGRSAMTVELAAKVARAIGGSTQFWVNMQAAHDVWAAEKTEAVHRITKWRNPRDAVTGKIVPGAGKVGKTATKQRRA